ncbi:unnamed protein product [Boreogadus saida]
MVTVSDRLTRQGSMLQVSDRLTRQGSMVTVSDRLTRQGSMVTVSDRLTRQGSMVTVSDRLTRQGSMVKQLKVFTLWGLSGGGLPRVVGRGLTTRCQLLGGASYKRQAGEFRMQEASSGPMGCRDGGPVQPVSRAGDRAAAVGHRVLQLL